MFVAALGAALRRRWGVFLSVVVAVLALFFLLGRAGLSAPSYSAESRVRHADPSQGLTRSVSQLAAAMAVAFPDGRPDPDDAVRGQALDQAMEKLRKDEDLLRRMTGKIESSVTVRPAAGGTSVRAVTDDRAEAVRLANAVAHALVWNAQLRLKSEGATLEAKAKDLGESLVGHELAWKERGERLQDRERRRAALTSAAVQVEKRTEDTRARQDRTIGRIRSLEAAEHRLRETLPSGPEEDGLKSAVLDRLRLEMNAIRSEIALRRLGRTPDHDDYKRLTARLAELDEDHRSELYRVRGWTIVNLKEEVLRIDDELMLLSERRMRHSLEIHGLGEEIRQDAAERDALVAMQKKLQDTVDRRLRLAQAVPGTVEDEALGAAVSGGNGGGFGWPAGAAIALVLGLAAAMAANRGDTRVRTDADVKRHLNLATLALVEGSGQALVLRTHPADPLSEAYSAAAAVLRGYLKEREFKVCAVTSAAAGDGKSTAAANLAVALARKGLNVALVDGDLRAPRLHDLFGVENAQGLSTVLLGADVDPELAAGATELAGLRLLPSGPSAELPPELLESGRMGELLRTLRERYDVVVLDGPPIGLTGDGVTLARLADTVVWVIRSGASTRGQLGWAKHLLRNLRADVAGAILTFAPPSGERRSYAYPLESART